jgi:hypothetical protein
MENARTNRFGIKTLGDVEKFFYKGVVQDAGRGERALVIDRMAIIYDPKTSALYS